MTTVTAVTIQCTDRTSNIGIRRQQGLKAQQGQDYRTVTVQLHKYVIWQFPPGMQGCSGFCNKLDALLWVLRLETGRDQFESYCQSVICMVSDQGALHGKSVSKQVMAGEVDSEF